MSDDSLHTPVLVRAVVDLLRPAQAQWIADCTVGLGGHAEALMAAAGPGATLIGIDRDASNVRRAADRLQQFKQHSPDRVRMFHCDYNDIREVLGAVGVDRVDALVADLGVASTHLDDPARGFSFAADGPLDMRLDAEGTEATAADLLADLSEQQLADVLFHNADERASRRIARAIVAARKVEPIRRTAQLAQIVQRAVGRRSKTRIHPATRTFQALRIAVNHEMESLDALLAALPEVLAPGARAAVISFHSLEDRRVKRAFLSMKSAGAARIITPKPLGPDDEELQSNPRSRSAKLRCIERL